MKLMVLAIGMLSPEPEVEVEDLAEQMKAYGFDVTVFDGVDEEEEEGNDNEDDDGEEGEKDEGGRRRTTTTDETRRTPHDERYVVVAARPLVVAPRRVVIVIVHRRHALDAALRLGGHFFRLRLARRCIFYSSRPRTQIATTFCPKALITAPRIIWIVKI